MSAGRGTPAAGASRGKRNSDSIALTTKVELLPGVGSRRAAALRQLGVDNLGQLIEHFPLRHVRHTRTSIDALQPGETATIIGQITAFRARRHLKGPAAVAAVQDNTGRCSATWFNAREFVFDQLATGAIVELTGKVGAFGGLPQFVNPQFRVLPAHAVPIGRNESETLDAIYPATASLPSVAIRRLIAAVMPLALPHIHEFYPPAFRAEHDLPDLRQAIEQMHRPKSAAEGESARRRLAYDELLLMQLAVQMARRRRRDCYPARPIAATPEIEGRICQRLPFTLTPAQQRVIAEIVADMGRPAPMNRLLQGDVGCGKTVVAVYAALLAIANGRQAAVLAPTELLARQHDATIRRILAGSRVRQAICVGGMSAKDRRTLREALVAGEIDLVVGTQALLESDIHFKQLGLVVVDEQHRLGVKQRTTIVSKGHSPHYLVMTATPIPRTLAMTVFGDLDTSTIDALPPGRGTIHTRIIQPDQLAHAWRFVASRLSKGEQAYIVYPLVNESEGMGLRAATSEFKRISTELLPHASVGLVHGKLSDAEKDAVMRDFAAGKINALVATTVIEVGIDVPNATVMLVQHADRYGLAQLHQLRGRVGRGGKTGYCYLAIGSNELKEAADGAGMARHAAAPKRIDAPVQPRFPLSNPARRVGERGPIRGGGASSPVSHKREATPESRMAVLMQTTDGFAIAEEDLRQRGPGELLGVKQHGLPNLRVADLSRDLELLMKARADAARLLEKDPDLKAAEWQAVRQRVMDRFSASMRFLSGA